MSDALRAACANLCEHHPQAGPQLLAILAHILWIREDWRWWAITEGFDLAVKSAVLAMTSCQAVALAHDYSESFGEVRNG